MRRLSHFLWKQPCVFSHIHVRLKLIFRIINLNDLSSCVDVSREVLRVRFLRGVCMCVFVWLLGFLQLHERCSQTISYRPVMLRGAGSGQFGNK